MTQGHLAAAVDFATYYWRETRWSSLVLFGFVGSNFLVAWSYRDWFLGLHDAPAAVWFFEWGVIIPCCALACAIRLRGWETRLARRVTLGCVAVIALALAGVRWTWVGTGAQFFNELNCYFLTGVIVMSGIEFRRVCAIAFPVLLLETVLSYKLYGWGPTANYEFLSFMTSSIVMTICGWQVERAMRDGWGESRYYETLAQRDPLTGLLNRRAFEERAREVLQDAAGAGRSVALAVVDLDQFKPYNDCYGHPAGDRALITFSQVLTRFARKPGDLAARIGGEEFVLLWNDADETAARDQGESVVATFHALGLPHERSASGVLTTSLGIHHVRTRPGSALPMLMQQADRNLYAAKQRGGNCAIATAE